MAVSQNFVVVEFAKKMYSRRKGISKIFYSFKKSFLEHAGGYHENTRSSGFLKFVLSKDVIAELFDFYSKVFCFQKFSIKQRMGNLFLAKFGLTRKLFVKILLVCCTIWFSPEKLVSPCRVFCDNF